MKAFKHLFTSATLLSLNFISEPPFIKKNPFRALRVVNLPIYSSQCVSWSAHNAIMLSDKVTSISAKVSSDGNVMQLCVARGVRSQRQRRGDDKIGAGARTANTDSSNFSIDDGFIVFGG